MSRIGVVLLKLWVLIFIVDISPGTFAQDKSGDTYPWCSQGARREFKRIRTGSGLSESVHRIVVESQATTFSEAAWPRPQFPEDPKTSTLLVHRVSGGTYYWWFDKQWFRVASEVQQRSNLIYGLGRVEQVNGGSATIDMGDAHLLRVYDKVAVIRDQGGYYTPVGTLRIAETYPTYSRAEEARQVKPLAGDIVLFVREFSQLKTGPQYMDEFLQRQMLTNSDSNRYSTERRLDTAMALRSYSDQYAKWERSSGSVVGYIEGASFANGQRERIEDLLKHIAMIRGLYQDGRNSLPAAGPGWEEVMPVLFGPTVIAQHIAAQSVVSEEDEFNKTEIPGAREVRELVRKTMYDRLDEERNLVAFLTASILEQSPKRVELWFQEKVHNSQFPLLANEEVVVEQLRQMLKVLRGED